LRKEREEPRSLRFFPSSLFSSKEGNEEYTERVFPPFDLVREELWALRREKYGKGEE